MSDIRISSLEFAVADAIASLARFKVGDDADHRFVLRPRRGLDINIRRMEGKEKALVNLTGDHWPYEVQLSLMGPPEEWVAHGPFRVYYQPGAHIRPTGNVILRWLEPSHMKSPSGLPMRHKVRSCTEAQFKKFWPEVRL